jgi:drug/metabolite transporter (DMT)-like permease
MIIQPKIKGYAYALLATVAVSTVYIFSKAALNQVSLAQFGVYWFAFAILFNALFTLRTAEHRHFHPISGNSFKILVFLGMIELVATAAFYGAISITENPAIPSFLRNMEYIFVTLFGVFLLKERFTGGEIIGILLTFTGAFVISYQKGATFYAYISGTSGLMLLATTVYGVRTIIAKKHIHTITPTMLAINRAIFLLIFALIFLKILGQSIRIPTTALINIAIGSFFGPFLTSIGQYSALKYIEASRAAIVQSTTALFVLLGAYLYFGKFPADYQLAGGMLTITGAMLLVIGHRISFRNRNNKTSH